MWEGDPRCSTPEWRTLRLQILQRDAWTCYLCGKRANEVDHIDGDRTHDHPDNLAAICGGRGSCHAKKSSREGNAARWGRRTRPTGRHPGLR